MPNKKLSDREYRKRIIVPADVNVTRGSGRRNFLPKQPHGDLLDDELRDLLSMLEDACELLDEGNTFEAAERLPEACDLVRSILGKKS